MGLDLFLRFKALFGKVDETRVERAHATGTQNTKKAPHHGAAYFSSRYRRGQILKQLSANASCQLFAEHLLGCGNAAGCLTKLKLHLHPVVAPSMNELG